jgi:peptide/nickel transport system substrate-binding protein
MTSDDGLDRRNFLRLLGVSGAAVTLGVTTGCGASSTSATTSGALRIGASDGSPNDTMDPLRMQTTFQILTAPQVYESLVELDEGFQPHGRLAQRFESTPDFASWTFHLRDGVTFHDGSPLTVEDVTYSLNRAIDPDSGSANSLASQLRGILAPDGIHVVDDRTVRFDLTTPYVFFPNALATRFARIYRDGTTSFDKPVGTGPFTFVSFAPGQRWEGAANPKYWRNKVTVDRLTVTNVPDESSRISSLLSGELDLIFEVGLAAVADITADDAHTVLEQKAAQWPTLGIDSTVAPFDNPGVVRAIKLAVDRDQVIENVYGGYATMGYDNPISNVDPYFAKLPHPRYDKAAAKRALAEAGHPDGITLPPLTVLDDPNVTNLAVVLKQQFEAVGIRFDIKRDPAATFWDNSWLKAPFYANTYLRRHPDEILKITASSDGAWHMSKREDPQIDAAIAAAGSSGDLATQKKEYGTAQKLIAERDTMVVPAQLSRLSGISRKVTGVRTNYVTFLEVDRVSFS